MEEHLKIANFGPVTSLDIEIKRITFFIGNQGTGKSTISKLLTIFRDILWRYSVIINGETKQQFIHYGINGYFKSNTYLEYYYDGLTIIYKNNHFSIQHTTYNHEELQKLYLTMLEQCRSDIHRKMSCPPQALEELSKDSPDFNLIRLYAQTLFYIPAERIICSQLFKSLASIYLAEIPISKPIMEYMSLFEKAQNKYSTYKIPFLNITYQFNEGKETVIFNDDGKSINLPLKECSSGLQSLLPMLMVIHYCIENNIFDSFVVEEPEQNLFPTNQRELLRFILSKCYNQKTRMVINTHSPYLLSVLNNSLYAAQLAKSNVNTDELNNIIPIECQVDISDCAVYSLGNDNNEEGYCKSIISENSGLIDYNYLDAVSLQIGHEFERLQDLYLSSLRNNR